MMVIFAGLISGIDFALFAAARNIGVRSLLNQVTDENVGTRDEYDEADST